MSRLIAGLGGALVISAFIASNAGAQVTQAGGPRQAPPTGAEIAAAAKAAKLDAANAGAASFHGKSMRFTPVERRRDARIEDLEAGAFVGVLENGAAGDETGLPAGKYDIMVAKVGDMWRAYAETGGKIIAEAARCDAKREEGAAAAGSGKPVFLEKGWCWTFCVNLWGFCLKTNLCF